MSKETLAPTALSAFLQEHLFPAHAGLAGTAALSGIPVQHLLGLVAGTRRLDAAVAKQLASLGLSESFWLSLNV